MNVVVGVKVIVGVLVMVGVLDGVGEYKEVGVFVGVSVGVGVLVGVLVGVGVGLFVGVEVDPSHPCGTAVTSMSISTSIVRELEDSIVIGSRGISGTIGTKEVETETRNLSPFCGCTAR